MIPHDTTMDYRQRLKDGLRHAPLKGLRPEKKPGVIRRSPMSERGPFRRFYSECPSVTAQVVVHHSSDVKPCTSHPPA
jgi:hypothetical protein